MHVHIIGDPAHELAPVALTLVDEDVPDDLRERVRARSVRRSRSGDSGNAPQTRWPHVAASQPAAHVTDPRLIGGQFMQVWQFNPSSAAALGLALASAGLTAGCTPDAPKQTQRGAAAAAASVGRTGASAPAAPRPSSGGAVTAAPNGPPPDEGSFVFEDFLAPVTPAALAASLSDWTAHVGTELRPVGITLFGDVLLIDRQNQIHVLDPSFGDVELVARSQEQFGARLQELAFQEALLRLRLARSVLGRAQPDASAGGALVDGDLQAGQVFGFRVPLILGGRPSAENVVRVSATTMLAMNALLLKQLDTAPFGEPVRVEFRNFPGLGAEGPNNARPSFVRTARDRPSLALQR